MAITVASTLPARCRSAEACSKAAVPRLKLAHARLSKFTTSYTSIENHILRESSPRAFQRYLVYLLAPRGRPFTPDPLVPGRPRP